MSDRIETPPSEWGWKTKLAFVLMVLITVVMAVVFVLLQQARDRRTAQRHRLHPASLSVLDQRAPVDIGLGI